jgi:hypothetical protein
MLLPNEKHTIGNVGSAFRKAIVDELLERTQAADIGTEPIPPLNEAATLLEFPVDVLQKLDPVRKPPGNGNCTLQVGVRWADPNSSGNHVESEHPPSKRRDGAAASASAPAAPAPAPAPAPDGAGAPANTGAGAGTGAGALADPDPDIGIAGTGHATTFGDTHFVQVVRNGITHGDLAPGCTEAADRAVTPGDKGKLAAVVSGGSGTTFCLNGLPNNVSVNCDVTDFSPLKIAQPDPGTPSGVETLSRLSAKLSNRADASRNDFILAANFGDTAVAYLSALIGRWQYIDPETHVVPDDWLYKDYPGGAQGVANAFNAGAHFDSRAFHMTVTAHFEPNSKRWIPMLHSMHPSGGEHSGWGLAWVKVCLFNAVVLVV